MRAKKTVIAFLLAFTVGMVTVLEYKGLIKEENVIQDLTLTKIRPQRKISSDENGGPNSMSTQTQHEELRYGAVVHGTDHIIIYNSVPKCGSRTFGDTSRKIFNKHSLNCSRYSLRDESRPENEKRRSRGEIRRLIKGVRTPAYVQGHGFFLPFNDHPRPVYINFIRDPVSRMVSAFYFTRFGDNMLERGNIDEKSKKMSIEECILGRYETCTRPGRYPEIFCGFNPRCGRDPKWALKKAKSNIDKYYTFIGITEDYEASLRVLEYLMPDMYNGTTELYLAHLNEEDGRVQATKTKNKQPLSQELNDTVAELFAVDYELYNFIYDKHRELKARFGID